MGFSSDFPQFISKCPDSLTKVSPSQRFGMQQNKYHNSAVSDSSHTWTRGKASLMLPVFTPVGQSCYGNAYNRVFQARSKWAGTFSQNNSVSYLYTSSNARGNKAICASYRKQVQMGLYKMAGLKSHCRAAACLHQKLRRIRYLLPEKRDAWKNRNIESTRQSRQNRISQRRV